MNFSQVLLLPFSLLYDLGTRLRNYLFDRGLRTAFSFQVKTISVGNLSVGGTGKTPAVEYLIRLLQPNKSIATLSRGYGRASRGFKIAGADDTARSIGDEPFQIYTKFPDICVTVGEDRALAIPFILAERPETEVILLDDAFQHRSVKPDLNIMLTTFDRPFYSDFILPGGRLREARKGANRADIIVVTKCPPEISHQSMEAYRLRILKYAPTASVYFSSIRYSTAVSANTGKELTPDTPVILLSGIANPASFRAYCQTQFNVKDELTFPDHHRFTKKNMERIAELATLNEAAIITTEKDYTRLTTSEFQDLIAGLDTYYLPIVMKFVKDGAEFDAKVKQVFTEKHT